MTVLSDTNFSLAHDSPVALCVEVNAFRPPRKIKNNHKPKQASTKYKTNGKSQRQEFNEIINLKIERKNQNWK